MNRKKSADSIIATLPYIFKKLKKVYHVADMPRQQFELLFKISNNDGYPISHYSDAMMIPKSNVTVASNKLVEDGLIIRKPSPTDRRIVILKMTDKGRTYLAIYMDKVKKAMTERLSDLEDQDVERIEGLLRELKEIMDKIKD